MGVLRESVCVVRRVISGSVAVSGRQTVHISEEEVVQQPEDSPTQVYAWFSR